MFWFQLFFVVLNGTCLFLCSWLTMKRFTAVRTQSFSLFQSEDFRNFLKLKIWTSLLTWTFGVTNENLNVTFFSTFVRFTTEANLLRCFNLNFSLGKLPVPDGFDVVLLVFSCFSLTCSLPLKPQTLCCICVLCRSDEARPTLKMCSGSRVKQVSRIWF